MYKFERYRQITHQTIQHRAVETQQKWKRMLKVRTPEQIRKQNIGIMQTGIAVEWAFVLAKSKYGLGLITSKLDQITRSSIVLFVVAMNVDRIYRSLLRLIFDIILSRYTQHEFMLKLI